MKLLDLLYLHSIRHDGSGCHCGTSYLPRSGITTRELHAQHLAEIWEAVDL